jgi:retron-type reverse transcriptase
VVEVLNAIYEQDFVGFSYGFRPGRGQHDALDALAVGIGDRAVNWILDADIAGFFDNISHAWMMRFVEHRVGDRRVLRLIRGWLRAGVVEDGVRQRATKGTPQGAVISPLLANIYLHYVYDLWAEQWRRRHARGAMIVVRLPTTQLLVSSTGPMLICFWHNYASAWRNSPWSCTLRRLA